MKQLTLIHDSLLHASNEQVQKGYLKHYLSSVSGDCRGYGLAALLGNLQLPSVKTSLFKERLLDRIDERLFELSYAFTSDLAETLALLWPTDSEADVSVSRVVQSLSEPNAEKRLKKLNLPALHQSL